MLHVTKRADYAARLMVEVAAQRGTVSTLEAARRQGIPYQFLRKVAQDLVAAGLLSAERGFRGGLSLGRPADSISLLDIVRATDEMCLSDCTIDAAACDRRDGCVIYPVWAVAQRELERVLGDVRLSDLAARHALRAARIAAIGAQLAGSGAAPTGSTNGDQWTPEKGKTARRSPRTGRIGSGVTPIKHRRIP